MIVLSCQQFRNSEGEDGGSAVADQDARNGG